MRITYTGRDEQFPPAHQRKLERKLSKLARLLDHNKGERGAHVILTAERHLQRAEITVHFHDHPLVGIAASVDQFTAILAAADKLEKQVLKLRSKWRDTKRGPKQPWSEESEPVEPVAAEIGSDLGLEKKLFRVNRHADQKPMTLEEALLEMEKDLDYLVYRDAETDRVSVLLRRRDGHFDLIEA
jgi:putative sigma-54 modulation protein